MKSCKSCEWLGSYNKVCFVTGVSLQNMNPCSNYKKKPTRKPSVKQVLKVVNRVRRYKGLPKIEKCDCIRFELTPLQLEHKPSIDWLYFGGRQQGRSYLLAVSAIEYAFKTGEWVRIRDHFPYKQSDTFLLTHIRDMVSGFGKWEFNKLQGEFRYCGRNLKGGKV